MTRIIRTPTRATGGITAEEKAAMDAHAQLWIKRAMRTDPIEPDKIVPAIEGLYAAAGLTRPRVVIVPSPLVMAMAYGAASSILRNAKRDQATGQATWQATRQATWQATWQATRQATWQATEQATEQATDQAAAYACLSLAGHDGLETARQWSSVYQGGNMWAASESYLSAARDILGLCLPEHDAYAHWEQAAIHGGFRVMHKDFCMVSDFPEVLRVDAQHQPHCADGPSHRWRDGWSLYHWHGVRIPDEWITVPGHLTPQMAVTWENTEQRRAAIEKLGWDAIIPALHGKPVDIDPDPTHGTLYAVDLPGEEGTIPARFLQARCGTGVDHFIPVRPDCKTVIEAQAFIARVPVSEFRFPATRT